MPLMDSANQIFGGLIGLFLFACLITLVIYWIEFPIIVTRYLKQMLQSQQENRRIFARVALSRRTFTASAHARRTDDEMIFRRPVCTSTRAISQSRKQLSQKN